MMLGKERVRVHFPRDKTAPPSSPSRVEHHQLTSLLLHIVLLAGMVLRSRFLSTITYARQHTNAENQAVRSLLAACLVKACRCVQEHVRCVAIQFDCDYAAVVV